MRKISSLALFAFLMPLAGCPAGDDTETDTVAETGNMTTMPGTETGSETTPPAESESGTVADSGTADSGTGPGGGGFCGLSCTAPADCAMGGNEADWECAEGFCNYIGTPPACDDVTCPPAVGGACAEVDGVSVCTYPCTEGGTECDLLTWECTGMDDAGNSICQPPAPEPCGGVAEGEPCDFGAGQLGVCTAGECVCTSDEECAVTGYACNTNG